MDCNMERLTSPATIKKILGDHGIVLSKRWGQNFFADGNILDKIMEERKNGGNLS